MSTELLIKIMLGVVALLPWCLLVAAKLLIRQLKSDLVLARLRLNVPRDAKGRFARRFWA